MRLQQYDVVRYNGEPMLFLSSITKNKNLVVMVKNDVHGLVTVTDEELSRYENSDLLGRSFLRSVVFHHTGSGMKTLRRFFTNSIVSERAPPIAMIGISSLTPVWKMTESFPLECSTDVSTLITCYPKLFERLKPHLKGSNFTMTEELFFELKLAL